MRFPEWLRTICYILLLQSLVKRIDLYEKLRGHEGCVNTIEFNTLGDHLVSGSDDRQIMFWEWASKTLKFSYPSGHLDNVFQARIMPFTDDRKIVTSSADGKVNLITKSIISSMICTSICHMLVFSYFLSIFSLACFQMYLKFFASLISSFAFL